MQENLQERLIYEASLLCFWSFKSACSSHLWGVTPNSAVISQVEGDGDDQNPGFLLSWTGTRPQNGPVSPVCPPLSCAKINKPT